MWWSSWSAWARSGGSRGCWCHGPAWLLRVVLGLVVVVVLPQHQQLVVQPSVDVLVLGLVVLRLAILFLSLVAPHQSAEFAVPALPAIPALPRSLLFPSALLSLAS